MRMRTPPVLQFLGFNTARAPFQDSRRPPGPGPGHQPGHPGERRAVRPRPGGPVPGLPGLRRSTRRSWSRYTAYDDFAAAMEAAGLDHRPDPHSDPAGELRRTAFKVAAAESHRRRPCRTFDLQIQVEALPWEEYAAALAAGNFDLYYGEVRLTCELGPFRPGGHRRQPELRRLGGSPDGASCWRPAPQPEDRAAALSALCAWLQQQAPILPLCFKHLLRPVPDRGRIRPDPYGGRALLRSALLPDPPAAAVNPRCLHAPRPDRDSRSGRVLCFLPAGGNAVPAAPAAGILSHGITAANGRFPRKGRSRTACGQRPFSSGVVRGPGIRGLRGNRCPARWCADDLHNR